MSQRDLKPAVRNTSSENKTKTNVVNVSKLNKVNNNKTVDHDKSKHQKETLIIEKDPVFVPVESWIENTQVNVSKDNEYKIRVNVDILNFVMTPQFRSLFASNL